MSGKQPQERFRSDYRAPDFEIEHTDMLFRLEAEQAIVETTLKMRRGEDANGAFLDLDGEDLELLEVRLDGVALAAGSYELDEEGLHLGAVPDAFELFTRVRLRPQENTQLSGLYRSNGVFCTQCEAEGFRRITFYPDRPDVMSTFRVRVEAPKVLAPVLLSNGNLCEEGALDGDGHYAVWEDPFPKPSYLFALVAGDLGVKRDRFRTMDGRDVALAIWSEHRNVSQLDHAMEALQQSMKWDEERFGLAYDLDIYNVVAVEDFNMGAMENKGLNVFNTAYVLASPETATDGDYLGITGVIGHEYFHNWTGNRVTCQDWFQLTLKEGLTVYRDQLFSADMASPAIKRISDVRALRAAQFREDSGPMAHPIRPESYIAMDNFYTATVYSKGAEVVRMYATLLGDDGFRRGMDLYFERHDGQAVSCDDFRAAMADANQRDLTQFERWYSQAGTPVVNAQGTYDSATQSYTLELAQSCPATPGQPSKEPFHIPVAVGLLGSKGEELVATKVLELTEEKQAFVFEDIAMPPVPSLLRGFSAPVKLDFDYPEEELALLLAHDTDSFQRWDAGQRLAMNTLLRGVSAVQSGQEAEVPALLVEALRSVLCDRSLDPALVAASMRLPAEAAIGAELDVIDPVAIHQARRQVLSKLAQALREPLHEAYAEFTTGGPYRPSKEDMARRDLRHLALGYLSLGGEADGLALAEQLYQSANNMSDRMCALVCLSAHVCPERDAALGDFLNRYREHPLVVDKWLAVQASSGAEDTLGRVQSLLEHEAFSRRNPNKVRSLVRTFGANQLIFHQEDGAGYALMGQEIATIDAMNPQVASRLAGSFSTWRRFDDDRQQKMQKELQALAKRDGLSKDTLEIVQRSLESAP
jgi:aminopeptidase N